MGLEPTTFCMASRRSSQLSYIRVGFEYSPALVDHRGGNSDNPRVLKRVSAVSAVVVALGVLGVFSGIAASSPSARNDPPVKSQTYGDPVGDNPAGAPDITGVVAENWADGTIGFKVSLPSIQALTLNRGVGVYIDTDANRTTGQFGDDYFIAAVGRTDPQPLFQLLKWVGSTWAVVKSPSLTGQFTVGDGIVVTLDKSEIGLGSTFNFDVWASVVGGTTNVYSDEAPDEPNYFTYTLGTAPVTTSTTTTTTTTTTTQPPPVAQKLTGRVGPGARISLTRTAKAGRATITVHDLSAKDDFHLTGPGVNRRTGVAFKGVVTWNVTLRSGKYAFRSDTHKVLRGTLKVSS
jgi:hypothetical protein